MKRIGHWNYSVTEDGRVYSHHKNQWLKSQKQNRGYHMVHLYHEGKCHAKLVHRLVAEAFIPNPDQLPEVNHDDNDKNNNHVDNLEWCTRPENVEHYLKNHHRTQAERRHQFTALVRSGARPERAAEEAGLPPSYAEAWQHLSGGSQ